MIQLCVLAILLCASLRSGAQSYTVSGVNWSPNGLSQAEIIFANLDGDAANVPEMLVAGINSSSQAYTEILLKNGNSYIEDPSSIITPLLNPAADFGDFDRDGDLDLAICGLDPSTNQRRTYIYRSNGVVPGTFTTNPISLSSSGIEDGSLAWGDYDNDGDLDLALMGVGQNGLIAEIYEYDAGNSAFVLDASESQDLVAMKDGKLAWGDYDADGDLDLIMTGMSGVSQNTPTTRLYQNVGNGDLTNVSVNILTTRGAGAGSVAWGDYDNDGDLDILLCGQTSTGLVTEVYENRGSSSFIAIGSSFTGIRDGEAIWIDYNTNGYLDILILGKDGGGNNDHTMELYENDQNGGFNLLPVTAFGGLNNGAAVAAGDINGDDKLDLAVLGRESFPGLFRNIFYENQNTFSNTVPNQIVSNPTLTPAGASLNISWSPPPGVSGSLVNGLSYNLVIGSVGNGQDVEAAEANLTDGKRYLYEAGNIQGTSWSIRNLPAGTYFAKVQAVDQDFQGGPFSPEGFRAYTPPFSPSSVFEDRSGSLFTTSPQGIKDGDVEWGDFNGDTFLDLLIIGGNNATQINGVVEVWENQNGNGFIQSQLGLNANLDNSDAAWGDYDNDGDLDLIVTGQQIVPPFNTVEFVTKIFENDPALPPTLDERPTLSSQLPGTFAGSVDWGDYDNDGDIDILITGRESVLGPITRIYRNDYDPNTNSRSFTWDQNAAPAGGFKGVEFGEALFGDYNQDGWLDFFVTGRDVGQEGGMYQNDGDGTFTLINTPITFVEEASIAWGDINNDGLLDLAVMGVSNAGIFAEIYQYLVITPTISVFIPKSSFTLDKRLKNGDLEFGDYNDDGFSDLIATGADFFNDSARTKVFLNSGDGLGIFSEDLNASADFPRLTKSSVAWGDYDGDNKLDVAIAGALDGSNTFITRVFKNIDNNVNNTPQAPDSLDQRLSGFNVEFSWNPPANHNPNSVGGLSYAIYIDTVGAGDVDVKSPHAIIATGDRRIAHLGDVGTRTSFLLNGLSPGTYNWSVQTIDQDFEGSAFAPTQTFTYELPTFINKTDALFTSIPPVPLNSGSIAWGDYTGDDSLDLIVIGTDANGDPATELYEYDQNSFVTGGTNSTVLADVENGSVDWGDINNDGFPELLITGNSSTGPISYIYENLSGGFISTPMHQFTGVENSVGEFADFNNDGLLDFLISGTNDQGTDVTLLYHQDGTGNFVSSTLPGNIGLRNAVMDWGDYNNDGYLDLIISGNNNGSGAQAYLFENDKNGGFNNTSSSAFANLEGGNLEFGDFDADGFLDVIQVGALSGGGTRITRILRNDGNGNFTLDNNAVDPVRSGTAILGDYNNDGYKDLLVVGQNGSASSSRSAILYRFDPNVNGGEFVEEQIASSTFEEVGAGSSAAWGDCDSDGKLDLIIIGQTENGPSINIYQNIDQNGVTQPAAPTMLTDTVQGFEVILDWQTVNNVPNPRGLSYNVYIGPTINNQENRAAHANLTTGKRKLVKVGQVNDTTSFRLKNLTPGDYVWSVQAIDADFEGGPFNAPQNSGTFSYQPPIFRDESSNLFGFQQQGFDKGQLAWGDIDGNGRLDLGIIGDRAGNGFVQIYLNGGGTTFSDFSSPVTGLTESMLDWVDIDHDEDLDLFISGKQSNGNPLARVYLNDGSGAFTSVWTSITGAFNGAADWADYDHDGDQDLIIMGDQGGGNPIFELYRNDGTGLSSVFNQPGLMSGDVSFVDIDRDGFHDIFATGIRGANREIYLIKNNGDGSFTRLTNPTAFFALDNASVSWGDYNNDGFPDLVMCGSNGSAPTCRVYTNNGGGNFTQKAILVGAEGGSVAWGDYDNDGYLDLVLVGTGSLENIANVFRYNSTTDAFENKSIGAYPLQKVGDGASVAWGDYNNDGKLDLALMGESASGQVLRLYENIDTQAPYRLTPPTSPIDTAFGDTVVLQWDPPTGYSSIEDGFTYNVSLGSNPGTADIISPMTNLSTGVRQVAASGNTGNNTSWRIIGLPAGRYYWRVQAIDQDYEGGEWISERFFDYTPPAFRNENAIRIEGAAPTGYTNGDMAFGDYNGDNYLDIMVTGLDESGQATALMIKNKNGQFIIDSLISNQFLNVFNSDVDWADYDNDGDLDVIIMGNVGNGNLTTRIYDNMGGGAFSLNIRLSSQLENLQNGEADWADYDHDGDLDLALTGADISGDPFSAIYENDLVQDTFIIDRSFNLIQVNESSLAWGDFDSDGYADLAICGRNGGQLLSKVYRNNGPLGGFTDMGSDAPLTPVKEGSLAWADFNSDGFQDLLLTGESTLSQIVPVTRVYRYNPSLGRFVSTGQIFDGIKLGKGIWGDYNDDGYADFLISGQNGVSQGNRVSRLYTNDGTTALTFTEDTVTSNYLRGANGSASPIFGDFDRDQKLDLVMNGQLADASPRKGFIVYRNIDPNPNVTPDAPVLNSAIVSADSVTFSWAGPANIPAVPRRAYSYQIRLRNVSNSSIFISPMTIDSSEIRMIAAAGGMGNVNQWSIRGLPAGTYEWTVQAIGPDFEESAFTAPADTFSYSPPVFVQMNQLVFPDGIPAGLSASSQDWGDYNKDGFLDLLVAGESDNNAFGTYLYPNSNGRSFQLESTLSGKLVDIREGKVQWVDINQDTWLDIFVSGLSATGPTSRIYLSQNGVDFVESTFPAIPNLSQSSFDWGDYDNDGDLDLILSGSNGSSDEIRVIRNDGSDGFVTPVPAVNIPQVNNTTGIWLDVDNDTFLDIILYNDAGFQIMRNTGNATFFAPVALPNFPSLTSVQVDCGDINRDGYTDLAVSGLLGSEPFTDVFFNDQAGGFNRGNENFTELAGSDIILGDYSDDNRLDLVLTGQNAAGNPQTLVYKQTTLDNFSLDATATANLLDISAGDLAWGDYDKDGKLDLAITGSGTTRTLEIFRNIERTLNIRPIAPDTTFESVEGSKVKLSWSAPPNSAGYTYNVSIGLSQNDELVKAGMSELAAAEEGLRRVVAEGNAGQTLEWKVGGLVSGRLYFWKVQAIGPDFEGSEWAEGSFTFNPPGFEEVTNNLFPSGTPNGMTNGTLAAADYDGDGDMDFLRVGTSNSAGVTEIYQNDNPGNQRQFTRDTDASNDLTDLQDASGAWGDYDNDGDPDLIVSGVDNANPGNHMVFVYENDGGRFTADMSAAANLVPLSLGDLELADFDNDGDLDLIICGNDENGIPQTDLYENENGVFESKSAPFEAIKNGILKSADYDKDGDMDLLLSGESLGSGPIIQLFTNTGDFSFSLYTKSSLGSAKNSQADWADFDNDGDLDLLLTGDNSVTNFAPVTIAYSYDTVNDSFVNVSLGNIDMAMGQIMWGDFNNDNWPDFIVNGQTSADPSSRSTLLYRNDMAGGFSKDLFSSDNLRNMALGSSAWIDFDNDGQLDVIMSGRDTSDNEVFSVFHNIDTIQSVQPPRPDSLKHSVVGATLVLEWEAPEGFDPATVDGLSYNLYLGSASDKEAVSSAHADISTGYRKIHARGNVQGNVKWRINNLPDGEYVWSVQTVDQGYEGSLFADEQTLSFNNPQPLIVLEDYAEFIDWGGANVESSIIIDDLNIVDQVNVYYRGITDSADFTRLTLNSPSNPYVFEISTDLVDEIGIEYYFEVLGTTQGFNAYSDTGYTYIRYPSGLPYEFTDMAFGKEVTDYNIISIPLVLDNNAIGSTLEEFGEYDIYEWRFWHYEPGGSIEYTNGLNNIETGLGYWLITKSNRSFNTGPGHTTKVKKSDPFTINLQTGWNQIGNPYAFNLSWNDILNANPDISGNIQGAPLGYTSAGYQAVTTISQYRGVFVRANSPMSLKIPVIKNNSINRTGWLLEADLPSPVLHEPDWKLGLHMKSGGLHSRMAAIGMHPDAEESRDKYDWYIAPRPSEYLELNFRREEDEVKNFTRDIVSTQKSFVWEFSINSNLSDPFVELSWNNESFGNSGLQLMLFDLEHQKVVDMSSLSSYNSYSKNKNRKFMIFFGSSAFIADQLRADKVHLGMAYPSPAKEEVHIPFSLPDNLNQYQVSMEILNQTGQIVASWSNLSYSGGFHEIIWDGKGKTGQRLSAGLYIYRLTVSEFGKQDVQIKKLLLD